MSHIQNLTISPPPDMPMSVARIWVDDYLDEPRTQTCPVIGLVAYIREAHDGARDLVTDVVFSPWGEGLSDLQAYQQYDQAANELTVLLTGPVDSQENCSAIGEAKCRLIANLKASRKTAPEFAR